MERYPQPTHLALWRARLFTLAEPITLSGAEWQAAYINGNMILSPLLKYRAQFLAFEGRIAAASFLSLMQGLQDLRNASDAVLSLHKSVYTIFFFFFFLFLACITPRTQPRRCRHGVYRRDEGYTVVIFLITKIPLFLATASLR